MEGEAQKQGKKIDYWESAIPQPQILILEIEPNWFLSIILKGTKALLPHGLSSRRKDLIFVMHVLNELVKGSRQLWIPDSKEQCSTRQECNPDVQRIAYILFQNVKMEWRKEDMFQNLYIF